MNAIRRRVHSQHTGRRYILAPAPPCSQRGDRDIFVAKKSPAESIEISPAARISLSTRDSDPSFLLTPIRAFARNSLTIKWCDSKHNPSPKNRYRSFPVTVILRGSIHGANPKQSRVTLREAIHPKCTQKRAENKVPRPSDDRETKVIHYPVTARTREA